MSGSETQRNSQSGVSSTELRARLGEIEAVAACGDLNQSSMADCLALFGESGRRGTKSLVTYDPRTLVR